MYELLFLTGQRAGVVVPCRGTLIAGRDSTCSLEVPDPRVSRSHARVSWDGVKLHIADTNSSNGTFVNDRPVRDAELGDGDVIRLGTTKVRVRSQAVSTRQRLGEETMVFGIGEQRAPRMSLSVPIAELEGRDTRAERSVLEHRLASMIAVSAMLADIEHLDELYDPVLASLFDLLPQCDRGFLLLGGTTDTLVPRAVRQRAPMAGNDLRVSRTICSAALAKKAAILYGEGGEDPIARGHSVVNLQIRSAIAIPLTVGDETVGLVVLDSRNPDRAFSQDDLGLAAAVCHQVAIAIKNAQLVQMVEDQTRTRANLMRFLPQAMAEQVLRGELDPGLGGRRYGGTILFSDLIGFTARSERLSPDELVASMNDYFSCVVPCLEREGGSIDKFMGDAIMAVFGIPAGEGDDAGRAVAAALAMQTRLMAFNSGRPDPYHMGVGINTGEVVAGNVGAGERVEYTVLGDTVNTAQRVETAACREQVLVTAATWQALGGRARGVELPPLAARNKETPISTFAVRGLENDGGETQLFLPVTTAGARGWLIRRLADESFLLLHEPAVDVEGAELLCAAVEWPGHSFGCARVVSAHAAETIDGTLRRSTIRLEDPSLCGLLGDEHPRCDRSWREMNRDST